MATHSSVLAWRIPGTEEPSGLPSTNTHRLHTHTHTHTHTHICMHTHHLLFLFLIRTLTNTDFDFMAWNMCYLGKCAMWSLTEYLILCFWEHCCMSVNWVRMINSFVQVFYILIFSLIIYKVLLRYATTVVDLSVSYYPFYHILFQVFWTLKLSEHTFRCRSPFS